MKTAKEYWKEKFEEYPQNDAEKLAVTMMAEYGKYVTEEKESVSNEQAISYEQVIAFDAALLLLNSIKLK
jgi:predicted regulator of amino acid metabolism with ACT domain